MLVHMEAHNPTHPTPYTQHTLHSTPYTVHTLHSQACVAHPRFRQPPGHLRQPIRDEAVSLDSSAISRRAPATGEGVENDALPPEHGHATSVPDCLMDLLVQFLTTPESKRGSPKENFPSRQ